MSLSLFDSREGSCSNSFRWWRGNSMFIYAFQEVFFPSTHNPVNFLPVFKVNKSWHCFNLLLLSNSLQTTINSFIFNTALLGIKIEVFHYVTFSSSTSTLRKITSGIFLARSAKIGAMKRHGPHHEAVKSTTTCHSIQMEVFIRLDP